MWQVAAWEIPGSPLHGLTRRPEGQPFALCKAKWLFPCKAHSRFPCETSHTPFVKPATQQLSSRPYIPRRASLTRPDRKARQGSAGRPYRVGAKGAIRRREV